MDNFIKLIPFVSSYPNGVKYVIAFWILLTAIIVILLIFVPHQKIKLADETEKPKIEKKEDINKQSYKSLVHEFFKTDFSRVMSISQPMFTIRDSKEKIEARLHTDFEGGTTFISLYIPKTPQTYDICKEMVNYIDKILALDKGVEVQASLPGERPTELKELKFSGRVFFYHESPIFESKLMELISLYKGKNLLPQFRGPDYAYEKDKSRKKTNGT